MLRHKHNLVRGSGRKASRNTYITIELLHHEAPGLE